MSSLFPLLLYFVQILVLATEQGVYQHSTNELRPAFYAAFVYYLGWQVARGLPSYSYHDLRYTDRPRRQIIFIKGGVMFTVFISLFLMQVVIRKSIPIVSGMTFGEVSYSEWGVSPFSGLMTVAALLLISSTLAYAIDWNGFIGSRKIVVDNLKWIAAMMAVSMLMLRRDLLGFLIYSLAFFIYIYVIKIFTILLYRLKVQKRLLLVVVGVPIVIFSFFISFFGIVNLARGHSSGLADDSILSIFRLYVSSPLANSLSIVNSNDSSNISLLDFTFGVSSVGKSIISFIGIEPGRLDTSLYRMPNFNVASSLGYFSAAFGSPLYLLVVGMMAFILSLLERAYKHRYPEMFCALIILVSGMTFTHFIGSLTTMLIFPAYVCFYCFWCPLKARRRYKLLK